MILNAETAQKAVNTILSHLGEPHNEAQLQALQAFHDNNAEQIKFLALTNPGDHYCRALNYLVSVPKLTPNTYTILLESLRATAEEVAHRTLVVGAHELRDIFNF